MKHINYLLKAEAVMRGEYRGNIRFDRTGSNTIVISCSGYCHMDLNEVESRLLKLGCKYDLAKGVQEFDRMCGRTFTHMIEPKAVLRG